MEASAADVEEAIREEAIPRPRPRHLVGATSQPGPPRATSGVSSMFFAPPFIMPFLPYLHAP